MQSARSHAIDTIAGLQPQLRLSRWELPATPWSYCAALATFSYATASRLFATAAGPATGGAGAAPASPFGTPQPRGSTKVGRWPSTSAGTGGSSSGAVSSGSPARGGSSTPAATAAALPARMPANAGGPLAGGQTPATPALPPLLTAEPLADLGTSHLGAYYQSRLRQLAPEAFGLFYTEYRQSLDGGLRRRGGCHGVKDELQFSHGKCLMYRQCTHQLIGRLEAHGREVAATARVPAAPAGSAVAGAGQANGTAEDVGVLAGQTDRTVEDIEVLAGQADGTVQDIGVLAGQADRTVEDIEVLVGQADRTVEDVGVLAGQADGTVEDVGALAGQRLLLRGPAGAGKSVALASLVEWARSSGWIVMYIPSAQALTRGGYFIRRPGDVPDAQALYDTPIMAKHILESMHLAHRERLRQLPCSAPGWEGRTLRDVVLAGMAAAAQDNAQRSVECCLTLRDELLSAARHTPVLFAIDNYNALYWETEYGYTPPPEPPVLAPGRFMPATLPQRTLLTVEQLPLADGFRLLYQPAAVASSAAIVASVGWSVGVSPSVQIPALDTDIVYVPRFSQAELTNAVGYYHQCGLSPEAPSRRQVEQLLALTNGNARELREVLPKMALLKLNLV